jgi:hypothetical protein
MPYGERVSRYWKYWQEQNRHDLEGQNWPEDCEREKASDRRESCMRYRIFDLNPFEQVLTLGLRAELWKDEKLLASEEPILKNTVFQKRIAADAANKEF